MSISHRLVGAGIAVGAALGAVAAPATADPDGPLFSGTYSAVGQYREAGATAILHVASKCPGCDATVTADNGGTGLLRWTGANWTSTNSGGCGPTETVITPSNRTGLVQNYTSVLTFLNPQACGTAEPAVSNGTRVGD